MKKIKLEEKGNRVTQRRIAERLKAGKPLAGLLAGTLALTAGCISEFNDVPQPRGHTMGRMLVPAEEPSAEPNPEPNAVNEIEAETAGDIEIADVET